MHIWFLPQKSFVFVFTFIDISLYFVMFFCSHHMHLYKCHSENPSRHNSFDDLMGDRALSDSEAGTSMFLLTEVCSLMIYHSVVEMEIHHWHIIVP